jgi:hypothetical protein
MNAARGEESPFARFRELSRVLRWEPLHRIAMLWTYFDESGLHKKAPAVLDWLVLGGAIATESEWESIIKEWDDALAHYEISVFHMADFEADEGEFKKFKNNKDDHKRLLKRLIDPVADNIKYVFGVTNWTGRYRKDYRQIHLACVKDVFTACSQLPQSYSDKISIVMAKHKDIKPKSVDDLFESMLGSNDWFSTCTVADVVDYRGLQVADMLAYEMCRSIRENGPVRYPLKRIKEKAEVKIFVYVQAAAQILRRRS